MNHDIYLNDEYHSIHGNLDLDLPHQNSNPPTLQRSNATVG